MERMMEEEDCGRRERRKILVKLIEVKEDEREKEEVIGHRV
jgi:hypothetical protein